MTATDDIHAPASLPDHIAIVMDGNGRWARQRGLPRHFGHKSGVKAVRAAVRRAGELGVGHLTLFAFSSENWKRPATEITGLMKLFLDALQREVAELHENAVSLRFVGDLSRLSPRLQTAMSDAEQLTRDNDGLRLNVAMGYGGRWEIVEAARDLAAKVAEGTLEPDAIDEQKLGAAMTLADGPDPDLVIRTGGEKRVSNFLLWHMAYSELYFSDVLWPDFDADCLDEAIGWYGHRTRRFGNVSEVAQEEAG
ncbi:MAG: polyprenyl diphosphate synthase [Pseudomonadota bacterium]